MENVHLFRLVAFHWGHEAALSPPLKNSIVVSQEAHFTGLAPHLQCASSVFFFFSCPDPIEWRINESRPAPSFSSKALGCASGHRNPTSSLLKEIGHDILSLSISGHWLAVDMFARAH